MKKIVISAVNLVEAGTLAILKDCLAFLSEFAPKHGYQVVAIVFNRELADFPNIEYIETTWPKKRWTNRLWYEYISMNRISKEIGPVYLWFSLHDTSPTIKAERQAVYCHNSFSFYKWKMHDVLFAPKIVLFALMTKYIYKTNIQKNNYLVVQQEWFRKAMSQTFQINPKQIIVSPPAITLPYTIKENLNIQKVRNFLFAGSPNSHKNFEVICKASKILIEKYHITDFKVTITVKGNENKYAEWLFKNWKNVAQINFMGFVPKGMLIDCYNRTECLIFPSKIESWGLPISEFKGSRKPMLLADLPYAHETAQGSQLAAFFDPDNENQLARLMKELIEGDFHQLKAVPIVEMEEPKATNWMQLFQLLLN